MGAEGSIELFQENELEEDLGMLKDESLKEMFNRNFENMIDVLVHPHRMTYDFDCLAVPYNGCDDYQVKEFSYTCADGVRLHCVKWVRDPDALLCVVYLHTNTRSLCDATELLPLCNLLNANLLAFDQRGCGKSEGQLSFRIVEDLTAILEALIGSNQEVKVVLWARGMASSIAVEYVTQQQQEMTKWQRTAPARRMIRRDRILQSRKEHQAEHQRSGTECTEGDEEDEDEEEGPRQYVKFLVLDSPFTSLKEVVLEAAQQIDLLGTSIPPLFVKAALYMFKNKIQESLDVDPYSVSPLQWLQKSRQLHLGDAAALPPCFVLAADSDEHIPLWMGAKMAEEWKVRVGEHSCWFREFPGTHFEGRDECLVMSPIQTILDHVKICTINTDDKQGAIEGEDGEDGSTWNMSPGTESMKGDSGSIYTKSPLKKIESRKKQSDDLPQWQNPNHVTHCNYCAAEFSMTYRKHHCRRCGLVVCAKCSSSKISLPANKRVSPAGKGKGKDRSGSKKSEDGVALVRACDTCVNVVHLTLG